MENLYIMAKLIFIGKTFYWGIIPYGWFGEVPHSSDFPWINIYSKPYVSQQEAVYEILNRVFMINNLSINSLEKTSFYINIAGSVGTIRDRTYYKKNNGEAICAGVYTERSEGTFSQYILIGY